MVRLEALTEYAIPTGTCCTKTWIPANVAGGLGMGATDAYHAGSVRQQLIQQMNSTLPEYGLTVPQLALVSSGWGQG